MKQSAILTGLCLGMPTAAHADSAAALFPAMEREMNEIGIASFSLSQARNTKSLEQSQAVENERAFAARWLQQSEELNTEELSFCDRIDHEKARHELTMMRRRADLGARCHFVSSVTDGLGAIAIGKAFFEMLLDWQLGVDIRPDEVFEFGKHEIAKANIRCDALQARMGFAGDDLGLGEHLRSEEFRTSDPAQLQRAFAEADAIVQANLGSVFAGLWHPASDDRPRTTGGDTRTCVGPEEIS